MRRQLVPAVKIFVLFTLLVGIAYPLAMTGVAQVLFGHDANGSLVKDAAGNVVGSSLLGQTFSSEQYFHPRPSAAGDGYDPTKSGASNLGPTNQKLLDDVADRAAAYREANGLTADTLVPVDAVTSSGSGLDPHISIANADLQAPRVAVARNMTVDVVRSLISDYTDGRSLGFLGEPGVNVLELNLALDRAGAGT
jgi:potassium-transporting ATPase KdpC subunit